MRENYLWLINNYLRRNDHKIALLDYYAHLQLLDESLVRNYILRGAPERIDRNPTEDLQDLAMVRLASLSFY